MLYSWIADNYIEIFGALTGVIYVFLEIRQKIWLWPVGILTSAVYMLVFFTGKFYADMSLQGYYLVISCIGWYWWLRGSDRKTKGTDYLSESGKGNPGKPVKKQLAGLRRRLREGVDDRTMKINQGESFDHEEQSMWGKKTLQVTRLKLRTGLVLAVIFAILYLVMWLLLSRLTDSPVPEWDSFITSLSIVATWMLARKIYEHWLLWIIVNSASVVVFLIRGLYPTVILYLIYAIMSFIGLSVWKRTIIQTKQVDI
jgi:nicotinamide mononucleotide transporter